MRNAHSESKTSVVRIEVSRDGWTASVQLSIGDDSTGYRIKGPKFNGSSKPLLTATLTENDAIAIRRYLDKAWPTTPKEERRRPLSILV